MPGPKPKPSSLKLLQGNPGHQKLNKSEPQPRPITPDCPDFLNEDARRIWSEHPDCPLFAYRLGTNPARAGIGGRPSHKAPSVPED